MTQEDVQKAIESRELYRRVFEPKNPEAAFVIAELMDQAGYFSANPETIKPELIALCNWLLGKIGVIHPYNVFRYSQALLSVADDEDLIALKKAIAKEDE